MGQVPVELLIENLKTIIGNLSAENAMLSALNTTKDTQIQQLKDENDLLKKSNEEAVSPD